MNWLTPYFVVTMASAAAAAPPDAAAKPAPPAAVPDAAAAVDSGESDRLATAAKLGRQWLDFAKAGNLKDGMKLWGYAAFDRTTPEDLSGRLSDQTGHLGRLLYSELLEDRSLIDPEGKAPAGADDEPVKHSEGLYITLRYFSEYEKGLRLETMMLHEPKQGGAGLKIIGLRRESLPPGAAGAVRLAADLGQLALLKLRGAPKERWEPFAREAAALAVMQKIALPAIPEAASPDDPKSGGQLVSFIMETAPPLFAKLPDGGTAECRAVLHAFAVLMVYSPGDETATRLAVIAGTEAEKANLPQELWKPLIRAVSGKQKVTEIHAAVQHMVAGIPEFLAANRLAADLKAAPTEIVTAALANMAKLPTYMVKAELTAADGRKCQMDASLAPGAMDLTVVGFDGTRERRAVTKEGFHVSRDNGETWAVDPDTEIAAGLCRTLQLPLDLSRRYPAKNTYVFIGEEKIDSERLYRFEPGSLGGADPAPVYWILMSRSGPVIRRAQMPMKFGEFPVNAVITYLRLGREVPIPEFVPDDEAGAGNEAQ